jgi:hypothetical protein
MPAFITVRGSFLQLFFLPSNTRSSIHVTLSTILNLDNKSIKLKGNSMRGQCVLQTK